MFRDGLVRLYSLLLMRFLRILATILITPCRIRFNDYSKRSRCTIGSNGMPDASLVLMNVRLRLMWIICDQLWRMVTLGMCDAHCRGGTKANINLDMVAYLLFSNWPNCLQRMVPQLFTSRTRCTVERNAAISRARSLSRWASTSIVSLQHVSSGI